MPRMQNPHGSQEIEEMIIKFRDNLDRYQVDVIEDGQVVYSHNEYRMAARWTSIKYGFTDAQMYDIYFDYTAHSESQ